MKERVGNCVDCGRPVDCLDGFLNGVVLKEGLRCFPCDEKRAKEKDGPR